MSGESDPRVPRRTHEWDSLDPAGLDYHLGQWETPKRSTSAFADFASERLARSRSVLDIGSGAGAATAQLARRHPGVRFTGLDYLDELASIASRLAAANGPDNVRFHQGDWYALQPTTDYDGVVSLQTLSWLPDYREPLEQVFRQLRPEWLAITSLFYPGDISCRIEVEEHQKAKKCFYNVYSIPAVARLCEQEGYLLERAEAFEIDIDLPAPADLDSMGTYTRRVLDPGHGTPSRIQISGPLLMNWHMLMIVRK
jgi:SAM-dependent methyltransferase